MRKIREGLDESTVENHLVRSVKAVRGLTIKLRFLRGWPDRVVLLPGGCVVFFELKRPVGGVFEKLQMRIHQKLRTLGFVVFVCRTKDDVNTAMEELCSSATLK